MRKAVLVLSLTCSSWLGIAAQTPAVIETRLLSRLANIEKWSNYGASTNEKKLESENRLLKNELVSFGKLPATLAYAFPKLKKEMQVVTSKDGRLRIYSWDMQTGGTMHEFDMVVQYRGASGKVYTWAGGQGGNSELAGGFFHDIFQLDGSTPLFLAVSTFIASGTLNHQSLNLLRINGERLDPAPMLIRTETGLQNSIGFEYDFSSVMDREERPVRLFRWNGQNRSFSFPVVVTDDEWPQGRITNKEITYRFDGKYFVKLS